MRIAHVITGLGAGGTPVMLHKVLAAQRAMPGIESCVVGLIQEGAIGQKISDLGVPVTTLNMKPSVPDPRGLWKLARTLRAFRPDLIQSWLYHADLMSSLIRPWVSGRPPVVWNLRHATLDPQHDSRSTRWTAKACAWLSRTSPASILVNTASGLRVHAEYGYAKDKLRIVPNGFDLERYRPDQAARIELRQSLGLTADTMLIGLVARFSELKGQKMFLEAMKLVAASFPSAHFVLCGTQITPQNETLARWVRETGCPDRIHLLGERLDVERVHAALDLEVSSSVSEAFSNSIGEALCCGVPCVVTDVGDSAWLIDDAGYAVPPQDPEAMAAACLRVLSATPAERHALSLRARQRMEQHFDIQVVARQYRDIWQEVINKNTAARSRENSHNTAPTSSPHQDRHAA
ncbi:MAG: glycosyltransferase [Planctomycetaceae bacterium]